MYSHKKIVEKRTILKGRLIKYNLLPSEPPYTKVHEELMDMLKSNEFDLIKNYIKEHKPKPSPQPINEEQKELQRKQRQNKNRSKINLKRINILQEVGLLPIDLNTINEYQEVILKQAHTKTLIYDIIEEHVNECNIKGKQKIMYRRLNKKVSQIYYKKTGNYIDIKEEDIIINEYCPFLGVKIDYRKNPLNKFVNNGHSLDRFNNGKGYVSGNVWVISRLANTIKLDSTIDELKTFCINIIKQYEKKIN